MPLHASYISTKDESRELMAVWPDIVRDLTTAKCHNDMPDVAKWLAKVSSFFPFFQIFTLTVYCSYMYLISNILHLKYTITNIFLTNF